jgi:1,4-dihydroxy-2-naphthoyl-CoA hydrolase
VSAEQTAQAINQLHQGTWAESLGLELKSATAARVEARVEVGPRHHQPYGIVHGGVYASIVESVASIGAGLDVLERGLRVVGLDNSTSFLHAVRGGALNAVGTPIVRGRRTQLWEVVIHDDAGVLVASGRVRLLVLDGDATIAGGSMNLRSPGGG